MKAIILLAKILIKLWAKSKCPYSESMPYCSCLCKYDNICIMLGKLRGELKRYE